MGKNSNSATYWLCDPGHISFHNKMEIIIIPLYKVKLLHVLPKRDVLLLSQDSSHLHNLLVCLPHKPVS